MLISMSGPARVSSLALSLIISSAFQFFVDPAGQPILRSSQSGRKLNHMRSMVDVVSAHDVLDHYVMTNCRSFHLLVAQPIAILVAPPRSAYGLGKGECGRMSDGSSGLRMTNQRNRRLWSTWSYCFAEAFGYSIRSADAVDRLQQMGPQQLLRWDGTASSLRLEPAKDGDEPIQGLIRQTLYLPEVMGLGYPLLGGAVGEQETGPLLLAAHLLNAVGLAAVAEKQLGHGHHGFPCLFIVRRRLDSARLRSSHRALRGALQLGAAQAPPKPDRDQGPRDGLQNQGSSFASLSA